MTETITASSVTGKPLIVWFQDSIPAAITTTVHAVHFRPDTDRILHADPVVEWLLHLPAHGMVTVGYVTVVPPEGANTARLAAWAKGLDAVEEHLNTAAARHPRPAKPSAPSTAPVLSVVGDSQQTASQILTTAGFQVNVQQGSGPAQYPDGVVFSQQPGAYGTAAKGATVTIYVQASAAPIAPTTAPPAGGNGGGNGGFGGGNGGFGGGNGGGNGGGR